MLGSWAARLTVAALIPILVACQQSGVAETASPAATASASAATDTESPTDGSAGESIELIFASGFPENNLQAGVIPTRFMDEIEERTDGRVTFERFFGGSLLNPDEILTGVQDGIADAGLMIHSFHPGQWPMTASMSGLVDLRIAGQLDLVRVAEINSTMLEEFPAYGEEWDSLGITPVLWLPTSANRLFLKEPVDGLDDLRGRSLRAFGTEIPRLYDSVGIVPVAVDFGEIYTSIQTGVIDGTITSAASALASNFHEVAPHILDLGPDGGATNPMPNASISFNTESWNRIAAGDREIILEVVAELGPDLINMEAEGADDAIEQMVDAGATHSVLPEEDVQAWIEASPDWYGDLADRLDDEGLPGTEFIERWLELADL